MNIAPLPPLRGLYLVTPDMDDTASLLARVAPMLSLGPRLLQYRNKSADAPLRRDQASALLSLCEKAGVPLLINDDWRLAAELGAAGAHLGRDDGGLREARGAMGPAAILGASCYGDAGRASEAARAGASYVAFGAFHPSSTKPGAPRAPLGLLAEAAALGLPRVAIGGITTDNAAPLVDAGADLLAVIGGVFDAADPLAAARHLIALYDGPHAA